MHDHELRSLFSLKRIFQPTTILFLIIFALVYGLQFHPQLLSLFVISMFCCHGLAFGFLKGHNRGVCRVCGQFHKHCNHSGSKNSMYGKHHSAETRAKISEAKKGVPYYPGKGKGIKHHVSSIGREAIARANRSLQKRAKLSAIKSGKPSNRKGKHHTWQARLHISEGIKKSKCFRRIIEKRALRQNLFNVREFYNFHGDVIFYPVTLAEHKFARLVLIDGRVSSGLITQSCMYEIPECVQVSLLTEAIK